MQTFAKEANNAAKGLGKSTRDYTEASLIYYQQGLNDTEAKARTDTTLKTANVTGQSTSAVSEELTAVWNGYKVQACLLYTSPSPRDYAASRMPSSA